MLFRHRLWHCKETFAAMSCDVLTCALFHPGPAITIGGGGGSSSEYESQQQQGTYGSTYGNSYSKPKKSKPEDSEAKPKFTVQLPHMPKAVIESNLKLPALKLKINSSPDVKVTANSRDPLEIKDEIDDANTDDIFKEPLPFPKKWKNGTIEGEAGAEGEKGAGPNGGNPYPYPPYGGYPYPPPPGYPPHPYPPPPQGYNQQQPPPPNSYQNGFYHQKKYESGYYEQQQQQSGGYKAAASQNAPDYAGGPQAQYQQAAHPQGWVPYAGQQQQDPRNQAPNYNYGHNYASGYYGSSGYGANQTSDEDLTTTTTAKPPLDKVGSLST